MRYLFGGLVAALLLVPPAADAGFVILDEAGHQTLLSRGRLKITPKDAGGIAMVLDVGRARMWVADAGRRVYWEGTVEQYCQEMRGAMSGAMAEMGFCPSGRLFEAAACGVPIVTDWWEGLDQFFTPDREILVARSSQDVIDALRLDPDELRTIASNARERVMTEHTAEHRAMDFERAIERRREGPNEQTEDCLGNHTGSGSRHAHSTARFF